MKDILKLLPLLIVALLFSCAPEEEDIFDDSSANRMEATLKANKSVLVGAKNGWLMEYYPSKTQKFGGFNLLAKFNENNSVAVASEMNDVTDIANSLYSLKQGAGTVLTFDTYNEAMHFFSNPENPAGIGPDGKGMEGDFEFLFISVATDKIVLKGKKTESLVVMTPLAESVEWADYLETIQTAAETMTFKVFEYQVNGKNIPVTTSYRTLKFVNEGVTTILSFIVTPTGYKLYTPLELEGVTVEEFKFEQSGSDDKWFVPTNGEAARLVVVYPPLNQQFIEGDWYFSFSELGAFGKPYWTYAKVNGLDAIGEELYYAYMGPASNGSFGFNFNSSGFKGSLTHKYSFIGTNKVKLTFDALVGTGDGVWYYNNAEFGYIISPISSPTGRTFTLTADNEKVPTWILLTDDDNANNTIKLRNTQVAFPFDK